MRIIEVKESEILYWINAMLHHNTSRRWIISHKHRRKDRLVWSWGTRVISCVLPAEKPEVKREKSKEFVSKTHCLNQLTVFQKDLHHLLQLVSWHKLTVQLHGYGGKKTQQALAKQWGGGRLTCADGSGTRLTIWETAPGSLPTVCPMWLKAKYEMLQKGKKQDSRSGLHNIMHLCNQSKQSMWVDQMFFISEQSTADWANQKPTSAKHNGGFARTVVIGALQRALSTPILGQAGQHLGRPKKPDRSLVSTPKLKISSS